MKSSSKPLVCACVRTKKATPNTMPLSVISMARFLNSRKRSAMARFVLIHAGS